MHAHQRAVSEAPLDQGEVLAPVYATAKSPHLQPLGDIGRGQTSASDLFDQGFVCKTVGDDLSHGKNRNVMLGGKDLKIVATRHAAVLTHDLADHRRWRETSQTHEIHRALCLTIPAKDPAIGRAEGKDMAGGHNIGARRVGGNGGLDGAGPVMGRNARGDPLARLNGDREGRLPSRSVIRHHRDQAQPVYDLPRQGEADQASSVTGDEINRFAIGELPGDDQIAFIFPVLVIDEDNHSPGFQAFDGVR